MEDEETWQDLFTTLSASKTVHLDRLTAKDLQDDTTFGAEADGRVLSRMKAEDIMEYVNNGGVHPYTMRKSVCNRACAAEQPASRAWPNCCTLGWHSNDEVDEADFSDMSVWEERSLIDELERDDYDLDGPEYHSDYDFDGEESIADSDMDLGDVSSDLRTVTWLLFNEIRSTSPRKSVFVVLYTLTQTQRRDKRSVMIASPHLRNRFEEPRLIGSTYVPCPP